MISTTIAVLLLAGTLIALVVVALGVGEQRELDTWLTARDSQSSRRLALAFLASGLGSWILFAPPEVGQALGILGVLGYAIGGGLPFVAFAWLGPKIREAAPHGVTLTDWARDTFGRPAQAWVALVSVFYMFMFVTAERIDTVNVHGTGCSFASATAAGLAQGLDPLAALRQAKDFVARGVRGGANWRLGEGHGPIDHFGWEAGT